MTAHLDPWLLEKIAEELFPSAQCCECSWSPETHIPELLARLIPLAQRYSVFLRPTFSPFILNDALLDSLNGAADWLDCRLPQPLAEEMAHKLGRADQIPGLNALLRLAKLREGFSPRPYLRLSLPLRGRYADKAAAFLAWAHEFLGVDDVRFWAHEAEQDQIDNDLLALAQLAVSKKYKTRLSPLLWERLFALNPSEELTALRTGLETENFLPPAQFKAMSYVVRGPQWRALLGEKGALSCESVLRCDDICIEPLLRPRLIANGNVEGCAAGNTFLLGNLKHLQFTELWNNELSKQLRRGLFAENPTALNPLCRACNGAGNQEEAAPRNRCFTRVSCLDPLVEEDMWTTHGSKDWPHPYAGADYPQRIAECADYVVIPPQDGRMYISDILYEPTSFWRCGYGIDKIDTYTPLLMSKKRYLKGVFAVAYSLLAYTAPHGARGFYAVAGLFDAENPARRIGGDSPGFVGQVVMRVFVNGKELFSTGRITSQEPGREVKIPLREGDRVTLLSEPADYADPRYCWSIWADASFILSTSPVVEYPDKRGKL